MGKSKNYKAKQGKIIRKEIKQRASSKQIIKSISSDDIKTIKDFNICSFSETPSREKMIECLSIFYNLAMNSTYLSEIVKSTRNTISDNWLDRKVDKHFIQEILLREMDQIESYSDESIAVRLCFWANRIAHRIEEEVIFENSKYQMNKIYISYFLNPEHNYDLAYVSDLISQGNSDFGAIELLNQILVKEKINLGNINTIDKLNNLFYGFTIRNELWTLKQQMIKNIILINSKNKNSTIKITALDEDEDLTIDGSETLRLIMREKNGIAPVIMHCNKEKINDFLSKNNIGPIGMETSGQIIQFAKNGKTGIHFTLDKNDSVILNYEAYHNRNAKELNDIIYRGDSSDER